MEKSDAFEIYKSRISEQAAWLNLHRQTSQQYFTLISVIFAALLAAFFKYSDEFMSDLTFFGFLLNILLGVTGMRMCFRYYQRFLEEITIMAKIEPLIGLINTRVKISDNSISVLPKDESYIPDRWIKSRKGINKSEEFVKNHKRTGSHKYVHWSFIYLISVNAIFIIFILFRFFLKCRWNLL